MSNCSRNNRLACRPRRQVSSSCNRSIPTVSNIEEAIANDLSWQASQCFVGSGGNGRLAVSAVATKRHRGRLGGRQ